jgi:hypothetical protein
MSEMGSEQVQRHEVGPGSGGMEMLGIEPGEHGPAEPIGSALDHAGASGVPGGISHTLDSAPGVQLDAGPEHSAGPEMGSGLEIGMGLAEPGESGPAGPESGLTAEHDHAGDTVPGRSAGESSAEARSETAGALPAAELTEPGEAGPAEAIDAFGAGDFGDAIDSAARSMTGVAEGAAGTAGRGITEVVEAVEAVDPLRRQ